jgi:hypothetical protein
METKKMTRTALTVMSFLMALPFSTKAYAWRRAPYEDAMIVGRSELIVVGRLLPESIRYVPHRRQPDRGASWEHHATLAVSEVLKGTCSQAQVPIIIHYGLDLKVGGYMLRDGFRRDARGGREDYPKDRIEIIDTGSSARTDVPLVEDAGKDNLWFLRRRSGRYGRQPGTGKPGIIDPEEVQPLALKPYFLCYLSDDPEPAVRAYAAKDPAVADRAKKYLDHLEIQRVLRMEDPAERFDRLLPFYLRRFTWGMKQEARAGVVSCGAIAGTRLKAVFDDPGYTHLREDIIRIWHDLGYREITPLLIELLERHDRFWARQNLKESWWNTDVGSALTRRRRQVYGEVYYTVVALRSFRDPRAKEALELTERRWEAIKFDNPQIVEECRAALDALAEKR